MEDLGYLQAILAGEDLPEDTTENRDIWVLVNNLSKGLVVVDQARILADALGAHVHLVLIKNAATSDLISAGADHVHVATESLYGDIDRTVDALAMLLEDTKPPHDAPFRLGLKHIDTMRVYRLHSPSYAKLLFSFPKP